MQSSASRTKMRGGEVAERASSATTIPNATASETATPMTIAAASREPA